MCPFEKSSCAEWVGRSKAGWRLGVGRWKRPELGTQQQREARRVTGMTGGLPGDMQEFDSQTQQQLGSLVMSLQGNRLTSWASGSSFRMLRGLLGGCLRRSPAQCWHIAGPSNPHRPWFSLLAFLLQMILVSVVSFRCKFLYYK